MIKHRIRVVFDKTIEIIFGVILFFLIISLAIGAIQLFHDLWELLKFQGITGKYIGLISDVLTLYVLIELSRSLIEYFDHQKLRLTYIVDAGIVFVIREILIGLFKHEMKFEMLIGVTIFLLVLGAIRTSAVLVYQREKRMLHDMDMK